MTQEKHIMRSEDVDEILANLAAEFASGKMAIEEIINQGVLKRNYPLILDDGTVYLFYLQPADKVEFFGDTTGWYEKIPFRRFEGTGLHYLKFKLPADARVEYLLDVNGAAMPDLLNPYRGINGLWQNSELAMPHYIRHEYFNEYLHGREGDFEGLKEYMVPSTLMGYEHRVHVYSPAGKEDETLPIVYFLDGLDYIRYALAAKTIDRMIKECKLVPVRAVFITPPNLHVPKIPNRSTEYGLNYAYSKFMASELVPYVEMRYKTPNDPAARLIAGDSYAGLCAFFLAFSNPSVFMNAYSQSGYFSFREDSLITMFRNKPAVELKLYFDIGTYETIVGADFIPEAERNFTAGNFRMKETLANAGYEFAFREVPEGHTWGNWRRQLIDALSYFFGVK